MPPLRPSLRSTSALIAASAIALGGVLMGRGELVALASIVLVSVVAALLQRPAAEPSAHDPGGEPGDIGDGDLAHLHRVPDPAPNTHAVRIETTPSSADAIRVRVSVPGFAPAFALLAPGYGATARFESARTGHLDGFRLDWVAVSELGETHLASQETGRLLVEPGAGLLGEMPLPHQLTGLTGGHNSRRRGEGDDLHDIAPFRSGDRLRRIDWRVTARLGTHDPAAGTQLFVRRTQALAEAVVMLVLDSRDDVGVDVRTWAGGVSVPVTEPTSLDIARYAAATMARSYLMQGDRVGLADLATRRRPIAPGAGRRQLTRITHALALSRPDGEPDRRVRPPQIPSGAAVIMISTFLDADAAQAALAWVSLGHRVIAVDVLQPPHVADLPPAEKTAASLVFAERRLALHRLRANGVSVLDWPAARQGGRHGESGGSAREFATDAQVRAQFSVLSRSAQRSS